MPERDRARSRSRNHADDYRKLHFVQLVARCLFLVEYIATFVLAIAVQCIDPPWNDISTMLYCSLVCVVSIHQVYTFKREENLSSNRDSYTVMPGLIMISALCLSFIVVFQIETSDDFSDETSSSKDMGLSIGWESMLSMCAGVICFVNGTVLTALLYLMDTDDDSFRFDLETLSGETIDGVRDIITKHDEPVNSLETPLLYDVYEEKQINKNGSEILTNKQAKLLDETSRLDYHESRKDSETTSSISHGDRTNLELTSTQSNDALETVQNKTYGISRILLMAKKETSRLFIGCVVLLIRLPFSLSIPHFVAETFGALNGGEYDAAKGYIMNILVAGSIDAALDFWCVYIFGLAEQRIVRHLRITLFNTILRQEKEFFDHHKTGELSSRVTADCGSMARDLTWFSRFSIEASVRVFLISTYMLCRCQKLAFAACSILPIVAMINKIYGDWLQQNGKDVQKSLADSNNVAQEAFSCMQAVLAFSSESLECAKYDKMIQRNYVLNVQNIFASAIYYMLVATFLINTCVQAIILFIGTMLIIHGELDPHVLLSFALYQNQLQEYCMALASGYTSLKRSAGVGDEVFKILDRIIPEPGTGSHRQQKMVDSSTLESKLKENQNGLSIEFFNVIFAYPSRPSHLVLRGLNLCIPAGATVAIVGASGCGKSTIISLIERFYDPLDGCIMVDGFDIKNLNVADFRKKIGIVSQVSGYTCSEYTFKFVMALSFYPPIDRIQHCSPVQYSQIFATENRSLRHVRYIQK